MSRTRLPGERRTAGKPRKGTDMPFSFTEAPIASRQNRRIVGLCKLADGGSVSARDCSVLTASNCCARLSAGRCR